MKAKKPLSGKPGRLVSKSNRVEDEGPVENLAGDLQAANDARTQAGNKPFETSVRPKRKTKAQ